MGEFYTDGITYRIPGSLTEFQQRMYVHLINWKWKNITESPGNYNFRGKVLESDAILPETVTDRFPLIHPMVLEDFHANLKSGNFPNRYSMHFNHMASSNAANVNLLLPVLLHPGVNIILKRVKPDFKSLAASKLNKGFRIGFWGGTDNGETGASITRGKTDGIVTDGEREAGSSKGEGGAGGESGVLGDRNTRSGTYVDIAIAYYNHEDELCLWMIEHKLMEREFAGCGGFSSKGRERSRHLCEKSFSEIIADKNLCYYHNARGFRYWELTGKYRSFFVNHHLHESCPFRNGMNQLWRKQLMGLALETDSEYSNVYFSVVKHPGNKSLDRTIASYKQLIDHNPRFSVIDSSEIVLAGQSLNELKLNRWVEWFKGLYNIL